MVRQQQSDVGAARKACLELRQLVGGNSDTVAVVTPLLSHIYGQPVAPLVIAGCKQRIRNESVAGKCDDMVMFPGFLPQRDVMHRQLCRQVYAVSSLTTATAARRHSNVPLH